MTECDECGNELGERDKNTAGHYRDRCMDCIATMAEAIPPHHETCTQDSCPVCEIYEQKTDI